MSIFRLGEFRLHSGDISDWKIDCDGLDDEDWQTLGTMLLDKLPKYRAVVGVPSGGLALAGVLDVWSVSEELEQGLPILLVDDVLTTGRSMEQWKKLLIGPVIGAVVFARGKCPDWITPLFLME